MWSIPLGVIMTPAALRWSKLIDEQEAAGLPNRAFADARGLNRDTLAWWRWRLRRTNSRSRPAREDGFFELVVRDPEPQVRQPLQVELQGLPARVLVDHGTDLALLRSLLEALS